MSSSELKTEIKPVSVTETHVFVQAPLSMAHRLLVIAQGEIDFLGSSDQESREWETLADDLERAIARAEEAANGKAS